jgi:hypothetical protein
MKCKSSNSIQQRRRNGSRLRKLMKLMRMRKSLLQTLGLEVIDGVNGGVDCGGVGICEVWCIALLRTLFAENGVSV